MKLSKQWQHWVKMAGLRKEWGRGRQGQYYLVGRNRRWRVNAYGDFECSVPLERFDRWENSSSGWSHDGVPKNKDEFLRAVNSLIAHTQNMKRGDRDAE